ncbi:MAG: Rhodanese domain protein [Bacteroidetes bacterium]|nr:Rhodanese domain protein [Bacteroidota bacterium]
MSEPKLKSSFLCKDKVAKVRWLQPFREFVLPMLVATVVGSSYAGVSGKGFFQEKRTSSTRLRKLAALAPAMISWNEARTFFEAKKALFIDARNPLEYRRGHIPGAINIPLNDFEKKKDLLAKTSKGKLLVTYCDGAECNSSMSMAEKLMELGYTNVKIFFGGWQDWEANKLPVQSQ